MTAPRAAALVAAAALLLASCAGPTPTPSIPADNATTATLLPTMADAMPAYDAATLDRLLGQLRGTPVVVNYWASWCDPCKEEAPLLTDAHARYGDRVQFVGIDFEDARSGALRFLERYGVRYPSLFDPAGSLATAQGVVGPPATLFYDADGDLAAALRGQLSEQDLHEGIAKILS